jgi:hypothetical protein
VVGISAGMLHENMVIRRIPIKIYKDLFIFMGSSFIIIIAISPEYSR